MKIVKLNGYEEIINAFNELKDVFPNLSKRVVISEYIEKISKFANVFSVVENNENIGIAAVYMNDTENRIAYLTLIGISHKHRNKGLGKKLLTYCENEAKKAGMQALKLEVRKDNTAANALYSSLGYSYVNDADSENNYLQKQLI